MAKSGSALAGANPIIAVDIDALAGTVVLVGVPTPRIRIPDLPLIDVFGRGGELKSSWYVLAPILLHPGDQPLWELVHGGP